MNSVITPDFQDEVSPMVAGEYVCRILSGELKESGKTFINKQGQEVRVCYVNWKLATVPDAYIVYHMTPINGRGAGLFKQFIFAAGRRDYQGGPFDINSVKGRCVELKLRVKTIDKPDGRTLNVFDVEKVLGNATVPNKPIEQKSEKYHPPVDTLKDLPF